MKTNSSDSVRVRLDGGPRDGDTVTIHARTAEAQENIMVRADPGTNPFPVEYQHAGRADDSKNIYVPQTDHTHE